MSKRIQMIRRNPMLWLLAFVPAVLAAERLAPESHTMLFVLGGLRHHVQEFIQAGARLQAALLFLSTIALLVPSAISRADSTAVAGIAQDWRLPIERTI